MANATQRKKKGREASVALVEFTAAAHEHVEPAFDVQQAADTSSHALGPFDVPSYGYLRHVAIVVSVASAGALGTGVLSEDFPFNILDDISLDDVNGGHIVGPVSGFDLFLLNLFGVYAFRSDPRDHPDYNASYTTAAFVLRLPVEIMHNNALGALANQNASAAYKVRCTVTPLATQLSTVGTATGNTYRVRGYLEAWSQPTPTDLAGRPQAMVPPRHGTTQYWSYQSDVLSAAAQQVRLKRTGNLIRTLIFIFRNTADGLRSTTNFPDPIEIRWDARQLINEARILRRGYMVERNPLAAAGLPAGVFAYQLSHDVLGKAGDGTPELWLPTVESTRFELSGTFGAAGTLRTLINDVAPVEVTQEERFMERSETGFNPEAVA